MTVALGLALAGCPQFFVYDLEGTEIDNETIETTVPEAVAGLQITATDVLTGETFTISNLTQNFSHDQLLTIASVTEDIEIWYTLDTSDPSPYTNLGPTKLFDRDNPISALQGHGTTPRSKRWL